MGNLTVNYLLRRFGIYIFTIFASATLVFIIARAAPGDPVETKWRQLEMDRGQIEEVDAIIDHYKARFGLDDPLPVQYAKYLWNTARFEFGYSFAHFPTPVSRMIGRALPWSLGLSIVTMIITFFFGNALGAIFAWERTPRIIKSIIPSSLIFTSVPSVLSSLFLLWIFAMVLQWFPLAGAYSRDVQPGWNWPFIASVIKHGFLPVMSILIVNIGWTVLGMRAMLVTIAGEDYVRLAEAKGLNPFYTLYRYKVRNALLPQLTGLALSLSWLIAGQVLVETIFAYPGMGLLIFRGIREQDFPVIQATSYMLILIAATSVLFIDLIYPLIDPRITHGGD
ncbi:MAG: ABC transporter permease [Chloroflexota bacterium]|nr:ABC transporter permease [Chloroflexota bacterium]